MMGHTIEGIAALLERVECPIHLHRDETEWVSKSTGVSADHFVQHESGDTVTVGGIDITLLHTPGHTPGSQCFLVDGRLVAGDTLFLEGCGRTDLPGSNPADMAQSLRRLAEVPDDDDPVPRPSLLGREQRHDGRRQGDQLRLRLAALTHPSGGAPPRAGSAVGLARDDDDQARVERAVTGGAGIGGAQRFDGDVEVRRPPCPRSRRRRSCTRRRRSCRPASGIVTAGCVVAAASARARPRSWWWLRRPWHPAGSG